MSWKTHIEELRARERLAEQMGGDERVARQRSGGDLLHGVRLPYCKDTRAHTPQCNEVCPTPRITAKVSCDGANVGAGAHIKPGMHEWFFRMGVVPAEHLEPFDLNWAWR